MNAWTALLEGTRTVFGAPSFALFTRLLTGWVCAPGRRTITAMIAVADPAGHRAHDAYHRFVRDGAWAMSGRGAGSAVAVVGLVFVLNLVGGARLDPVGVLWGLAAAFGLATYFVLSSKVDNDLPPVAMASAGMTVGTVVLLGLGAMGVLPMHASFGAVDFVGQRVSWLVPVLGLSFVAAAIAYVAGIGAARLLGPKLATFVGLTEVVFAVLFAWLLLGELPTGLQLAGGALIMVGIALVRVDELRPGGTAPDAAVGGSAEALVEAVPMISRAG